MEINSYSSCIIASTVLLLSPLASLAQEESDPDCSPLAEAVSARSELAEAQDGDLQRAELSIISAMRALRESNGNKSIRELCPQLVDRIAQYVDPIWIDGIVVTGVRRAASEPVSDAGETEVPDNWRPFTFNGYRYYVVPLAED